MSGHTMLYLGYALLGLGTIFLILFIIIELRKNKKAKKLIEEEKSIDISETQTILEKNIVSDRTETLVSETENVDIEKR